MHSHERLVIIVVAAAADAVVMTTPLMWCRYSGESKERGDDGSRWSDSWPGLRCWGSLTHQHSRPALCRRSSRWLISRSFLVSTSPSVCMGHAFLESHADRLSLGGGGNVVVLWNVLIHRHCRHSVSYVKVKAQRLGESVSPLRAFSLPVILFVPFPALCSPATGSWVAL